MAKEKRDALDELFSSVSVRDTLDMVNGGNDDGMEWVPRKKTDDSHKEEPTTTNNKKAKKSDSDEKKKKVLPSADRKKTGGKKTGQQRSTTQESDSRTHEEILTGGSHLETFLLKFNERKGQRNKNYTRAVLMPTDIIDTLQMYFGRHSADILCILVEEFFESEKENLRKYITRRMNIIK